MDKRSQVSRLIMFVQSQVRSIETNYNNLGNQERALAALDHSVHLLMKVWELIKFDDDKRFQNFLDTLADEQSFKKDE